MYPDLISLPPTSSWGPPLVKPHLKRECKEPYRCCPYSSVFRGREVCLFAFTWLHFRMQLPKKVVKSPALTALGEKAVSF